MVAGSRLKDRARAEAKGDSLVDVDEAEDVASSSSSSSIRFRRLVSPSSNSSFRHTQIQLQQFNRVAEAGAGAEDSRVVMAAVVMAVMGMECAGSARALDIMSVCARGWRRLRSG